MDVISCLLQEARGEYIKQKHTRWRRINYVCTAVLSVLFITPIIIGARNNKTDIESMYSTLYVEQNTQNTYYIDEFDAMGVI